MAPVELSCSSDDADKLKVTDFRAQKLHELIDAVYRKCTRAGGGRQRTAICGLWRGDGLSA